MSFVGISRFRYPFVHDSVCDLNSLLGVLSCTQADDSCASLGVPAMATVDKHCTSCVCQARSLKDVLIAMDRTVNHIKDFVNWHSSYCFLNESDLEAWTRITWWEGPDRDGYMWLMIDNRAAVTASKVHGAELIARVLVSNVSEAW